FPVGAAEADYEKLIQSINAAPSQQYHFAEDALGVRDRINEYLHQLEMVDGFSSAQIGAIGKLKGYFARISLVLHVAQRQDPLSGGDGGPGDVALPDCFSLERGQYLAKQLGVDPQKDSLSAGLTANIGISRRTAEAAAKVIREFLLP